MTTEADLSDKLNTISVVVSSAAVAGSAAYGWWYGVADLSLQTRALHAIYLTLVIAVVVWAAQLTKRQMATAKSQLPRLAASVSSFVLPAPWLPWSDGATRVFSGTFLFGFGAWVNWQFLSAVGGPDAARRKMRGVGLGVVTLMVLLGSALVVKDGAEVRIDPDVPDLVSTSGCLDLSTVKLSRDDIEQISAVLAREGPDAGCVSAVAQRVPNANVRVAYTNKGYVIAFWSGQQVIDLDNASHAAAMWGDAYTLAEGAALFGSYLPSDRHQCPNGAFVAFLDRAGLVRVIVASANYKDWYLIPAPILPEYTARAAATGALPMPTSLPSWNGGVVTQGFDITVSLSGISDGSATLGQLTTLCPD